MLKMIREIQFIVYIYSNFFTEIFLKPSAEEVQRKSAYIGIKVSVSRNKGVSSNITSIYLFKLCVRYAQS